LTIWEHLGAYIVPGLLRGVDPHAGVDYTIAVHHFLVADLRHCTLCGGRPDVLDQVLGRRDQHGIAVVLCLPCRRSDPDREMVRQKLEVQYDAARCAPTDAPA
jgi:hypothetical protein